MCDIEIWYNALSPWCFATHQCYVQIVKLLRFLCKGVAPTLSSLLTMQRIQAA